MPSQGLITAPHLIIADEPLSGLDVTTQQVILELLLNLRQEFDLSFLFISHDLRIVEKVSDHVVVMRRGEVVEAGPPADVFSATRAPYTKELLNSVLRPGYKLAS